MSKARIAYSCALSLSFWCLHAGAQPDKPAPPAAPPEDLAPTPPTDVEPQVPDVQDRMLAPVPPSKNRLSSWREAIRLVRARSSNLRIAAAQVRQASAQSRQALAGALPTLTGTANIQTHLLRSRGLSFSGSGIQQNVIIPDPATSYGLGLAFRWMVFAPGTWASYKTAKRAELGAHLDKKDAERIVLAGVADAIVAAVTAERLAEVSRVSLRSALSTLDLTRRRARLGAASAFDVIRSEQEVALTRAQIVASNESVRQAREALGLTLGFSEPWMVTPTIKIDGLAADAQAICPPESNVETRPDVLAAKSSVDVAERNLDSTDWDYVPTVSVVSDLSYRPVDRTPNNLDVVWTVGAVLSWNLYDGGLRYGQRDVNQAALRTAREQLTQTKRQARVEVTQARRGIQVAKANLGVSRRSRDLARESARLSRVAFINGGGTSFDLVDAARRLREAELDLAIKEFDVVRAQITALLALATCNV